MRPLFSLSYPVLNYLTTIKLLIRSIRLRFAGHTPGPNTELEE